MIKIAQNQFSSGMDSPLTCHWMPSFQLRNCAMYDRRRTKIWIGKKDHATWQIASLCGARFAEPQRAKDARKSRGCLCCALHHTTQSLQVPFLDQLSRLTRLAWYRQGIRKTGRSLLTLKKIAVDNAVNPCSDWNRNEPLSIQFVVPLLIVTESGFAVLG